MAPPVQSGLGKTSLMPSKQKTRLAPISTSRHLHSIRLQEDMEASKSIVVLEFLYLIPLLLGIMSYLLGIGSREVTE